MTIEGLGDYGMERMSDDEIDGFLSSQNVGVLGLPTADAPSMRPLSFWYDGESRLYFLYVLDEHSRKAELSERVGVARFLVYRAETPFNWRSILLTGTIDPVTGDGYNAVEALVELGRRPDLFERASASERTRSYEFRIEDRVGFKHLGLPPGLEKSTGEKSTVPVDLRPE